MISRLAETYRQQRKSQVYRAFALSDMLDQAARHSIARLTERELALGAKCKRHCDESRRFAAVSNVSDACLAIGAARAIAQSNTISEETRLLCLAEIAPAEAYMERLFDSLPTARALVEQSLRLDQELEDRFGHHTKLAHRVHMLTISSMLLFQQHDATTATVQLAAIFKYLAGVAEAPADTGSWSQAALSRLPAGMRNVLALQAVEILYAGLTVWRELERKDLLDALLADLGRRARKILAQPAGGTHANAGDYLSLLELSSGDECAYLLCGTELLERTRVRSLIYSIALDCTCCCIERAASAESAGLLAHEIRHDAKGQILPFPLHTLANTRASARARRSPSEVSA